MLRRTASHTHARTHARTYAHTHVPIFEIVLNFQCVSKKCIEMPVCAPGSCANGSNGSSKFTASAAAALFGAFVALATAALF